MTWDQLESLRDRGQLARFQQVSQDNQTWISADSLARLFPRSEEAVPTRKIRGSRAAAATARPDEFIIMGEGDERSPESSAAAHQDATWFYARDGARQGPLRLADLERMIDTGEIGPDTLFWKSGMSDWTPGFLVPELASAVAAAGETATAGATLPSPGRRGALPAENARPRTSLLAFASLVLGLLFGVGSLPAIILAVIAFRAISRSNGTLAGKHLALAGLILGVAGLVILTPVVFWLAARGD
jgi:hypothetical protein